MKKIIYFTVFVLFSSYYIYSQEIFVLYQKKPDNFHLYYLPKEQNKVYKADLYVNEEKKSVSIKPEFLLMQSKDFKFKFKKSSIYEACSVQYNSANEGDSYYKLIKKIEIIKARKSDEYLFILKTGQENNLTKEDMIEIYEEFSYETLSFNEKNDALTEIKQTNILEKNNIVKNSKKKEIINNGGAEMDSYIVLINLVINVFLFVSLGLILLKISKINKKMHDLPNKTLDNTDSKVVDEIQEFINYVKAFINKYQDNTNIENFTKPITELNTSFNSLKKDIRTDINNINCKLKDIGEKINNIRNEIKEDFTNELNLNITKFSPSQKTNNTLEELIKTMQSKVDTVLNKINEIGVIKQNNEVNNAQFNNSKSTINVVNSDEIVNEDNKIEKNESKEIIRGL